MPTNYTGVSDTGAFDSGGNTLPVDGDALNAASVVDAFKQVLDLLQGLNDRAWTAGAGNEWANDHDWLVGTIAKFQGIAQVDAGGQILHTPTDDTFALIGGDQAMVNTWGLLSYFKVNSAPNVYIRLFRGKTNGGWMFTFNANWNEGAARWDIDNAGFISGGFQAANGVVSIMRDTTGANFTSWESSIDLTPYVPAATTAPAKGVEANGPIKVANAVDPSGAAAPTATVAWGERWKQNTTLALGEFTDAGVLVRGYNISGCVHVGAGDYTVTLVTGATNMLVVQVTPIENGLRVAVVPAVGRGVATFKVATYNNAGAQVDTAFMVSVWGL